MESGDLHTVEAMIKFGGSFVVALGNACQRADADNLDRIKSAFPEYWRRYTKLAEIEARGKAAQGEAS